MMRAAYFPAALAAAVMLTMPAAAAMPLPGAEAGSLVAPAVSSDAHRRGRYGNYGGLKSRSPTRPYAAGRGGSDRKEPYPYRYYYDTERSVTGCHWMARRAIQTNSRTWWSRYRACTD